MPVMKADFTVERKRTDLIGSLTAGTRNWRGNLFLRGYGFYPASLPSRFKSCSMRSHSFSRFLATNPKIRFSTSTDAVCDDSTLGAVSVDFMFSVLLATACSHQSFSMTGDAALSKNFSNSKYNAADSNILISGCSILLSFPSTSCIQNNFL